VERLKSSFSIISRGIATKKLHLKALQFKKKTESQVRKRQSKEKLKMTKLTIVANITAAADKIDLVKAELLKLIKITRAEVGCINYDLHQDNENPAHFLFYENWQSRELWQNHMGNQHLLDYLAATEGSVEEFVICEMTTIA
jgi:quinol monooxygenase YgiN